MKRISRVWLICAIFLVVLGGNTFAQTTPEIVVTPDSDIYYNPVEISITGLPAESEVTVQATTTTSYFMTWESQATFIADAEGRVDVAEQAPISGTYTGVEPMGLFWSMQPPEHINFPFVHAWQESPLEITFDVLLDDEVVASTTIERTGIIEGVERVVLAEQVSGYNLRGELLLPPGDDVRPAVLVLGGSEGGLPARAAQELVTRGYAALALAYFNYDDLPDDIDTLPLEYFDAGLTWLREQERIDPERIAIMGLSKGAEATLLVATRQPDLSAAIAISPTHLIWQGLASDGDFIYDSSWSVDGESLDYTRFTTTPVEERTTEDGALRFAGVYDRAIEFVTNVPIPVEDIAAPVLLISGEDDQVWSAAMMGEMVRERMEDAGRTVTHNIYPEGGHLPFAAYLPTTNFDVLYSPIGPPIAYGGTMAGNARFAIEAQADIFAFLETHLGE